MTRRSGWLIGMLALWALAWPWRAGAEDSMWERDGLDGRQVRALALVSDPSGLVALTGGSRDPMPLWLRDSQGWSQPASGAGVPGYVLALAPLPDGGLLLGTGRDIADQPGVFWVGGSLLRSRRLYDARAIGALAVASSRAGAEIFAATAPWGGDRDAGSDLLRRDAASESWSEILHGSLLCLEAPSYFKQVIAAPSDPGTIFALEWCLTPSTRQTQLWRSDDRGQSWEILPRRGAAHVLIGTLAVDPTDADVLYLAGLVQQNSPAAGLERSLDGGQTWSPRGDGVDGLENVRSLLVDPRSSRRVLAGTDQNGVFMSDDRGESWRPLPGLEGLRIWSLLVDEASDRLYAATGDGIWRMPLP